MRQTNKDDGTIVAIIALYDGARFIERSVDSILRQTRLPEEIIVVDDGSSDNGPDLVREMARHAPVRLLQKPNGGQSSARNYGVAHSTGHLIAFLDQDDFWYPSHIETLIEPLAASHDPMLGWSYADLDVGDEDGTLRTPAFLHTRLAKHPKADLLDCVAHDMFILPSASLIRRPAFKAVGGFDERLSGYEDDDLFLRLFEAGYGNVFIDEALSMWCIHGSSATFSPRMARSRMIYASELLARHGNRRAQDGTRMGAAIASRFLRNLWGEVVRADRQGDFAAASATLEDIRSVLIPHLSVPQRLVAKGLVALLERRWLSRIVAVPRLMAGARKMVDAVQKRRTA